MNERRFGIALIWFALVVAPVARAQSNALARDESAAVTDDARALFVNPAGIGQRYPSELWLAGSGTKDHARFAGGIATWRRLGLAMTREPAGERRYGMGLSFGDALRLGWANELRVAGRPREQRTLDARAGLLLRTSPWWTAGASVAHVFEGSFEGARLPRTYTIGLGLRPLALARESAHTSGVRLTLTGDVVLAERESFARAHVRVGGTVEPLPGVLLQATAADHGAFTLAVTLRGARGYLSAARRQRDGEPDRDWFASSTHTGEDRTLGTPRSQQRVALVRMGGVLVDEALGGGVMGGGGGVPSAPYHAQLERALADPRTRGVFLELSGVGGMAQLEELRPRLQRLTAAGKPVVAFMPYGGTRGDLYLASAASRVVASPAASFLGLGMRAERRYYRAALERAGIRMDRSSVGDYKSAVRNYSVDSTPPADTVVIQRMLSQRQQLFVEAVTNGRRITPEQLLPVLDGREYDARALKHAGVIDSVGWREDALATLGQLTGLGRKPRTVNLRRTPQARERWATPARIAVVYAGGSIVDGRSGNDLLEGGTLGDQTFAAQLERAMRTPGVQAVVLRVDSPGGSSSASFFMDHAVERLKRETRKPVVVSMASVAASGGYFLSAHADRIVANKYTVTGSIGVLFVKPSFEGLYEKLGVRQDDFERGAYMRGLSMARRWRREDQAAADSAIKRTYRTFVERVMDGRKLETFEAYGYAQGRPWMGEDAAERKLVDAIGGMESAIAEARRLAGIPKGEQIALVEFKHPRGSLIERALGSWLRERVRETFNITTLEPMQARSDDWVRELD